MDAIKGLLAATIITTMPLAFAETQQISSYEQMVKAVETGNDIKAIVHFDRCQTVDPALQSELMPYLEGASTRFNFTRYLHYKIKINGQLRDTVTTTMTSFFEYPAGSYWSVFSQLSLYDDNTARLHVSYHPLGAHIKHKSINWLCEYGKGDIENTEDRVARESRGIVLFNNP
jgi:hypothetical protein